MTFYRGRSRPEISGKYFNFEIEFSQCWISWGKNCFFFFKMGEEKFWNMFGLIYTEFLQNKILNLKEF